MPAQIWLAASILQGSEQRRAEQRRSCSRPGSHVQPSGAGQALHRGWRRSRIAGLQPSFPPAPSPALEPLPFGVRRGGTQAPRRRSRAAASPPPRAPSPLRPVLCARNRVSRDHRDRRAADLRRRRRKSMSDPDVEQRTPIFNGLDAHWSAISCRSGATGAASTARSTSSVRGASASITTAAVRSRSSRTGPRWRRATPGTSPRISMRSRRRL